MFRFNVIFGIFLRNVQSYFSGVLGYIIIVAFVTVCALLAFSQEFFANNDASLDQLSSVYPWLLLFFVPAITMGAWANERKSGTDVLLFTLPASDWEILLGKYLAVCAVYTIALLFSVTQLVALQFLGQPDWSVVLSTYYGYWLAGLTLLSIGLFASSLTRDSAAAFVLGMVFCAVPVLGSYFIQGVPLLDSLSVQSHVDRFASGVVYVPSLFYFAAIILVFLYLNHIVIARRLWVRFGQEFMLTNFFSRTIAMVIFLAAGYFLLDRISGHYPAYLDLTSENLYTLNRTTTDAIDQASEEGTRVTLEAYISEEVPAQYVPVKKQLQTLLSQYDRLGGGTVVLRSVSVSPTSDEATQAEEAGVEGVLVQDEVAGKRVQQKVYLGVVVKTENGETVLSDFDGSTSIEYEITRAMASLIGEDQFLTVGILETDMQFTGLEVQGNGIDLEFGRINEELKKFYKLRNITSSDLSDLVDRARMDQTPGAIEPDRREAVQKVKLPDVLMVPGVSSLDQPTMDQLVAYIELGRPVLIMDDPVPFYFPTYMVAGQMGMLRGPAQNRFQPGSPPAELFNCSAAPKASLTKLEDALGIRWTPTRIVWNSTAEPEAFEFPLRDPRTGAALPWPDGFGSRQNALVFLRGGSEQDTTFNPEVAGAAGLRDLMMIYAGTFRAVDGNTELIPWVTTQPNSGTLEYDQYSEVRKVVTPQWDPQLNRQVMQETEQMNQWTRQPERILKRAAGLVPVNPTPLPVVGQIVGSDSNPRNVIIFTDMDFISDLAFECSESMPKGLDNVLVLQNAIETLAGDSSFISLRGRRPKLRPLERIDEVKQAARRKRLDRQAELEKELQEKLADAQQKLNEKTAELQANQDLSFIQRLQMTATAASEEQRKFDREMKKAEEEFEKQITKLEVEEKKTIEWTERRTRFFAVLLPPLPALAIGIAVVLVGLVRQAKAHR